MADINVERKGPSIWPWIIGLLVLALLIWAIAEMVDTDEQFQDVAVDEPTVVEEPPAAIPAPGATTPEAAAELSTLMPLGPEDHGQPVRIEGEVVGTPTPEGVWVNAEGDHVLFVQTPIMTEDGQTLQSTDVQEGESLTLVGVVTEIPANQATAWIDRAELRNQDEFADWNVHQDLMIAGAPSGTQMAPGQQPGMQQPGMQGQQGQPTTPGDTVMGRY